MAAVEFPVEALGPAVSDGTWFWAPATPRLESACLPIAPRQWSAIARRGSASFSFKSWRQAKKVVRDFFRISRK
jgi:hypothetical protein